MTPIAGHRATENRLRHYDRLGRFPRGRGRGRRRLRVQPGLRPGDDRRGARRRSPGRLVAGGSSHRGPGRGRDFQRRLARATAAAWRLAAGADYRFRTTEGPPQGRVARLTGCYIAGVMRAATRRPWVRRRLAEVLHLLRPPSALFGPGVLARLAWDRLAGRPTQATGGVTPLREGTDRGSRSPRRTAADLDVKTAAGSRG